MILLIDIGNTRTKWAVLDDKNQLSSQGVCLNADIAHANLTAHKVQKAFVSNVAGLAMAQQVTQLLTPLVVQFLKVTSQACGLKNNYATTLGADRWAALIAAWHHHQQACVVVNAGTAITVDAIVDGIFIGGTIMPGFALMQKALSQHTALLNSEVGVWQNFPINTSDAMQTGRLNAVVGAIHLTLKQLKKMSGKPPLLILSGGDAHAIAATVDAQILNDDHLKQALKQVMITENLVLQGLALLAQA